jgi:hypothetical protein
MARPNSATAPVRIRACSTSAHVRVPNGVSSRAFVGIERMAREPTSCKFFVFNRRQRRYKQHRVKGLSSNWRNRPRPIEPSVEHVDRQPVPVKSAEGETMAVRSGIATKPGNARGAKGSCCIRSRNRHHASQSRFQFSRSSINSLCCNGPLPHDRASVRSIGWSGCWISVRHGDRSARWR